MRRVFWWLWLVLPLGAFAHIGSPNVFFEGQAGPYPVRIVIRPPDVVPGLAEISVRVSTNGVHRVTALPTFWDTGRNGAPPPDQAEPVRGETNLYHTTLWLMKSGAYSVDVAVEGEAGKGTVVVPVDSIATARRNLPRGLGAILAVLALVLFTSAIRLAGAAFGESTLDPNQPQLPRARRRSWIAMTVATLVFTGLLVGGKKWWDVEDANYRNNILYRPEPVIASVAADGKRSILHLEIGPSPSLKRAWTPLIPDHGKMMHLFLVRQPGQDALAHLHPIRRSAKVFEVAIPPIPVGHYQIYADVTHENGFSQTLTAEVEIPAQPMAGMPADPAAFQPTDPDDSWHIGTPATTTANGGSVSAALPTDAAITGYTIVWKSSEPLRDNRETSLRYELHGPDGRSAPLEPYMGMLGHAAIRRADGSVFAHLHPVGTISMASQQFFVNRLESKTNAAAANTMAMAMDDGMMMDHSQHTAHSTQVESVVSFPYEFPKPGPYRIWVQMKSGGRVFTGVFDPVVGTTK